MPHTKPHSTENLRESKHSCSNFFMFSPPYLTIPKSVNENMVRGCYRKHIGTYMLFFTFTRCNSFSYNTREFLWMPCSGCGLQQELCSLTRIVSKSAVHSILSKGWLTVSSFPFTIMADDVPTAMIIHLKGQIYRYATLQLNLFFHTQLALAVRPP